MKEQIGYRLVIGLTGPIASGKGFVAKMVRKFFEESKSIHSVLLSDFIREVVRDQGKQINRDTLREAGNTLRLERGPGAWVERMVESLSDEQEGILIVDSIRNPGEIETLRNYFGDCVFIIATDAPIEDRIQWTLRRNREDDSTNTEEIERQMRIEMEDNPGFGFSLERCRNMADLVSIAKGSKEERITEIREGLLRFLEYLETRETEESTQELHRKAA